MSGAIVHEWIESTGGAEKVVESFIDLFPGTDVFCLWDDAPGRFKGVDINESVLSRTPLRHSKALALPVMPLTWRYMRGEHDWALVSSHLFAHHVRFTNSPDIEKYVYVHTPARYLWNPELDSRGNSRIIRSISPIFRSIDRRRANESSNYVANSNFVRERIASSWGIEANVIHPPVDVEKIQSESDWRDRLGAQDAQTLENLPSEFILGASRLVEYKRMDAVIRAGAAAKIPVVIAGSGPDLERLKAIAQQSNAPVVFLGRVSDELLYALYNQCTVYAFLGVEDFGIMPVEAMAAGGRVVANRVGGAGESLVNGESGALCNPDDLQELLAAISDASGIDRNSCRRRASKFSENRFKQEIASWVGHDRVPGHGTQIETK